MPTRRLSFGVVASQHATSDGITKPTPNNAFSFITPTRASPLDLFPVSTTWLADELPADAFTDEIDLFGDSTVQLLVGGFALVVLLLVAAKSLLGQMDAAIESVLVDFENTMKRNHETRWTNIEKRLEPCATPDERAQKLFEIMEKLQADEPEFMARLQDEMKQQNE